MKRVTVAFVFSAVAFLPAKAGPGCIYTDSYLFSNPSYLGGLIGTIPAPAPVKLFGRARSGASSHMTASRAM